MAVRYATSRRTSSAALKVTLSGAIGIAILVFGGLVYSWRLAPLLGWEAAAAVYLGWTWLTIVRLDDTLTADYARREDPSRSVTDVVVLLASLASLLALFLVLTGGQAAPNVTQIALGVLSVVLSWVVIHTVYMLKYAELFYNGAAGGVEFAGTTKPSYADFAYLAFTMGMTFQVSDTGFKSPEFRSVALRHALLSYLFGTIIVATTVNLIAGLSK